MSILLTNCHLITPLRIIKDGGVLVDDGIIKKIISDSDEIDQADKVINLGGKFLAPGFIDIHSHGGGGYDFMDGTVEAFLEAARAHLKYGTTTIVPTTLTSTHEKLEQTLDNFHQAKKEITAPDMPGLHLEGPYFAQEQRGAQDPRFIKNPDPEDYNRILDYSDDIIRWTLAPELPGALAMARELKRRNIILSIGHTNAVYDDVLAAFEAGFQHITHLYSGMSMVRRINAFRYAGVVESAYLIDEMTVEIIADGKHLPASLLNLIYKIKGADKICLITDSMRAAGMPPGEYILGNISEGQKVIVEDGVAKLLDRTAFAGSVATADRLIRTLINLTDIPLIDAVKMMTLTPARVMGLASSKGSLTPGKDADLVAFDEDINISLVMVGGEVIEGINNETAKNMLGKNQV